MICRLNPVSAFEAEIQDGASILTDGGIETRIMFETDVPLPPHVQVAGLVKDPTGGPVLRRIYESYVDDARSFSLPVIIGTPTFRASLNFVRRAGLGGAETVRCLNADVAAMHCQIRAQSNHRRAPEPHLRTERRFRIGAPFKGLLAKCLLTTEGKGAGDELEPRDF